MLTRALSFFAIVATALAQNQCTSLGTLVHGTTGAPSGLSIPDCSYITANVAAICNTLGSWDIINANTCYLKGPGYGCVLVNGQFSSQETFYCQVGPATTPTSTYSSLPTVSGTASSLPTVSGSASPSPSGSGSASSLPTVSGSASPSSSGSPSTTTTNTPMATVSSTVTATMTSTPSRTPTSSFTPVPSTNITVVYLTPEMNKGVAAAIGLSSVFGFCILFACLGGCIVFLRRTPPPSVIERRASAVAERRPSLVKDPKTPKATDKKVLTIRAV